MNPFKLLKAIDPTGISHLISGLSDVAIGAGKVVGLIGAGIAINQNNDFSQEGDEGIETELSNLDIDSSEVGDSIDIGDFFS